MSESKRLNRKRWIVNTFGGAQREDFEISVIRADNAHGRKSYGWFDADKLLISHNGGPCRWPVTKAVWARLIIVAAKTADELNAAEGL